MWRGWDDSPYLDSTSFLTRPPWRHPLHICQKLCLQEIISSLEGAPRDQWFVSFVPWWAMVRTSFYEGSGGRSVWGFPDDLGLRASLINFFFKFCILTMWGPQCPQNVADGEVTGVYQGRAVDHIRVYHGRGSQWLEEDRKWLLIKDTRCYPQCSLGLPPPPCYTRDS